MNATRLPGFSATASIYRGGSRYQATSTFFGPRHRETGTVRPALRPTGCRCYKTMKGPLCCCSLDIGIFGITGCINSEGEIDIS